MVTQAEIERPRTPAELRQFVADTRAQVEVDAKQLQIARRHTGLYKMFVDEIIPLSLAAEHLCAPTDRLKPVYGNQGYDVLVLDFQGKVKEKVEIAKPYDGKARAEDVRLLEQRGYGAFHIQELGAGLLEVAARILKTAKEKSVKDYSDCTLLIAGVISPPFDCEIDSLTKSAELLCEDLKRFSYIAKRVILVVPPLQQCFIVQEQELRIPK